MSPLFDMCSCKSFIYADNICASAVDVKLKSVLPRNRRRENPVAFAWMLPEKTVVPERKALRSVLLSQTAFVIVFLSSKICLLHKCHCTLLTSEMNPLESNL